MSETRAVYSPRQTKVIDGFDLDTFRPLPYVVAIQWKTKKETKGGVLIPQNRWRKGFMQGEVLNVGAGCSTKLLVGETVQFDSLADKEFLGEQDPADRDTVFLIREEDIHGIIRERDGVKSMEMLNEYVMVKPDLGPEEINGIAVPDHLRATKNWTRGGRIVAVGERVVSEHKYMGLGMVVGDHILYDATVAHEVLMNGEMNVIIRAEYVLCVMDDEQAARVGAAERRA